MRSLAITITLMVLSGGCASAPSVRPAETSSGGPHGQISQLSTVEGPVELCSHRVPEKVCALHHPELVAEFKRVNDWCGEHAVPESQCLRCHPDLTFEALPKLPEGADLAWLSKTGEDFGDLGSHATVGKVTVFDFYADWCAPCRKVDAHVYKLLQTRKDLSVRKVNVVDWDSAVAKRHLRNVSSLPHLVVFGKDGKQVSAITGFDLPALDVAIAQGEQR